MIFDSGVASQSIDIQIVDDTGLPVTGLLAAGFPALKYSIAGANPDVTFPALSDLAALTSGYTSGGVKERGEGVYRLDLPDTLFATAGRVKIRGEAANKHVIADTIEIAPPVNTVRLNGTAQTARDIGASVLLTSGTGTGQIDLVNGQVNANLTQILAAALTESTAGNLAGAFNKLFDVAAPVFTAASVNQGGDGYTELLDPTYGLSALMTSIDAIGDGGAPQDIADAVWANSVRTLTAGQLSDAQAATIPTTGTLATSTGPVGSVTGDVLGSVGSVSSPVTTVDSTDIGAIKAKTDNLPANPAAVGSVMDLVDSPNATAIAAIVSAIMNGGSIDGASLQGVLRLIAAAVVGKVAGLPGTSITQRAIDDSKVRLSLTLDSDGNITAVTTDAT